MSSEFCSDYYPFVGTLEPTGGIINNWDLKAPFIFRELPTGDTVTSIVYVQDATVKVGNPLPTQVKATLDDGRVIPVTVCWHNGDGLGRSHKLGVLCGVPDNVSSSSHEYVHGWVEDKYVMAVQTFPQMMDYRALPNHVKVILEDATQIDTSVCWYVGNLLASGIVYLGGTLCGLTKGVINPYKLYVFGTFESKCRKRIWR